MQSKNEIKAYIVQSGMTMRGVVDILADQYGWSRSLSNFCGKLSRNSIRYSEMQELAEVLGYEIVWKKRRGGPSHQNK